MFLVLPQFPRLTKTNKAVTTCVGDNGVNIRVVGQEGVYVMNTGSWVTMDLGRSTDHRHDKISHH